MTNKVLLISASYAAALLLAATSCVKDELHDTPHPDYGKITVTADWTDRGDDVNIPAEWTVTMGGYTGTEIGETHAPDYLFAPGSYTLAAYNTPENITVSGTTATVAPDSKVRVGQKEEFQGLQVPFSATLISNAPGWLLTSVQEVTVEADTDYELTATMHQQVRQLTLVIEPTGDAADRIESIEGSLSGAAGTLDFATGTYGAVSDVALHFTKITEGSDAGKWTATVRLLGITGNTQTLTATLTLNTDADGTSSEGIVLPSANFDGMTIHLELSDEGSFFNWDLNNSQNADKFEAGKKYVYDITVNKTRLDVTATITDWTPGNGENGEQGNAY